MKNIFLFLILIPLTIYSQTPLEIINKAEDIIKGETAYGNIEMTVLTPDYERTLAMESWWVGNEKALIVIKSPRREKGNKTLKIGNEMWSYLSNTETTIKIPPSMMLQSWNGSDFTNDDLVRETDLSTDYKQTLLEDEVVNDELCWKVQLIPNPDVAVVWGKLFYWVRQKDFIPARIDYYDEKGVLKRYMEFTDVKEIGGRMQPSIWRMVNEVKKGNITEFKVIDMKFDIKIPDRIFSFQELERGK